MNASSSSAGELLNRDTSGLVPGVSPQARQRGEPLLGGVTPYLADKGDPVQAGDLPLAFDTRGMILRQAPNELANPLTQLKGEVRRGGTHELPHVLDGDGVLGRHAVWMLSLAHLVFCGTASSRASISAWTDSEMALRSPITQPWL